jgi:uncharacterized protein YukE
MREINVAKIGADIDQLGSLKQRFDTEAQAVIDLTNAIDAQLHNTWWIGGARDRFQSDWDSSFKPNLQRLHDALSSAGIQVQQRADALRQAGS